MLLLRRRLGSHRLLLVLILLGYHRLSTRYRLHIGKKLVGELLKLLLLLGLLLADGLLYHLLVIVFLYLLHDRLEVVLLRLLHHVLKVQLLSVCEVLSRAQHCILDVLRSFFICNSRNLVCSFWLSWLFLRCYCLLGCSLIFLLFLLLGLGWWILRGVCLLFCHLKGLVFYRPCYFLN